MKTKGIVVLAGILLFIITCKDKDDPAPSSHTYGLPDPIPPDTSATPPDTTTLPDTTSLDTTTYIIAGDTSNLYYFPNHQKVLSLSVQPLWASDISYPLDFDNNFQSDLVFSVSHFIWLSQQKHFLSCGISSGSNYVISPSLMDNGDTIFFDEQWVIALEFAGESWCDGNVCPHSFSGYYNGAANKFVGCRVINASDTLYGWVRIDIASTSTTIIRDFAYLVK